MVAWSHARGRPSAALKAATLKSEDRAPGGYFALAKAEDIQPRAPFSSSTSIQTPLRWPVG